MAMPQAKPKRAKATVRTGRLLLGDDQADRAVEDRIADSDGARASRLGTMDLVLQARAAALERELETLNRFEDPGAARVEEAMRETTARAQQLRLQAAQARLVAPRPPEDGTAVHGHVLDAELAPVAGASVYLVDAQDNRVRGVSAETDESGYFALEYTPPASKRGASAPEVRVRVATRSARVLGEEAEPRRLAAGAVEYAEIVLAQG
jgi:hypothetical protein